MFNEVKRTLEQQAWRNNWLTSPFINRNGDHGRTLWQESVLSKKIISVCLEFAKDHLHTATRKKCWRLRKCDTIYGVKRANQHEHIIPMVMYSRGRLVFRDALLLQGLDSLPSSRGKLIPNNIKVFYKIISGQLSISWSSVEVWWCGRTNTRDINITLL